jgi:hypothetical protein
VHRAGVVRLRAVAGRERGGRGHHHWLGRRRGRRRPVGQQAFHIGTPHHRLAEPAQFVVTETMCGGQLAGRVGEYRPARVGVGCRPGRGDRRGEEALPGRFAVEDVADDVAGSALLVDLGDPVQHAGVVAEQLLRRLGRLHLGDRLTGAHLFAVRGQPVDQHVRRVVVVELGNDQVSHR